MYYRVQLFLFLLVTANSFAQSVDTAASLQKLQELLKQNTTTEKVLTDDQWMFLHATTAFRQLIKENTKTSKLTIITNREPGQKIKVNVSVKDNTGRPVTNAIVYVYHTDNRGYYAFDTTHVFGNEGDRRHARLFGYLKTDEYGNFFLQTIHPRGYPKSSLPSHIHCEIESVGHDMVITELLFDEDPRLTNELRARSEQQGFMIAKEKEGEYSYSIHLRQ